MTWLNILLHVSIFVLCYLFGKWAYRYAYREGFASGRSIAFDELPPGIVEARADELAAVLDFAEKFEDRECLARDRISPTFRRFVAALARKEHRK